MTHCDLVDPVDWLSWHLAHRRFTSWVLIEKRVCSLNPCNFPTTGLYRTNFNGTEDGILNSNSNTSLWQLFVAMKTTTMSLFTFHSFLLLLDCLNMNTLIRDKQIDWSKGIWLYLGCLSTGEIDHKSLITLKLTWLALYVM